MARNLDLLQGIGRILSTAFGRDSKVIRALRPAYEKLLATIYNGRGIPWSINGVPFRIDPTCRHLVGKDWDADVAAFLRDRVKPGALCLDVGANAGVYVLQFCHWSAPNGRVIAFEPNPITREILQRHIAMNGYGDRVEVIPAAVSDREGSTEFHFSGSSGMSRLGKSNPVLAALDQVITVNTITLDGLCEERSLRPDWMLIDIEGYELKALSGARELLSRNPQLQVIVEMHPDLWPAEKDVAVLKRLLTDLGLELTPLNAQKDPFAEHGQALIAKKVSSPFLSQLR